MRTEIRAIALALGLPGNESVGPPLVATAKALKELE